MNWYQSNKRYQPVCHQPPSTNCHLPLVSQRTMVWAQAQAFNIWKANGVIFRRIEMHNTIQIPFIYHYTMCHWIKIVHRIEILHGWKIMLIHDGFQIVIAILYSRLYYIIQRTKSIYHHRMRSNVSYVNILMVNSEHTCSHSIFLAI